MTGYRQSKDMGKRNGYEQLKEIKGNSESEKERKVSYRSSLERRSRGCSPRKCKLAPVLAGRGEKGGCIRYG